MPVIAVASAAPAAAASMVGLWEISQFQAHYTAVTFPTAPGWDGFYIDTNFIVSRADGGTIPNDGAVVLTTDTGDTDSWHFGAGGTSMVVSTDIDDNLTSLDATTLTLTIGGEVHGPYPIDRSALQTP